MTLPEIERLQDVPVSKLTTFGCTGVVEECLVFHSLDALQSFIPSSNSYLVLGKGSNSLLDSDALDGPVVRLASDMTPVRADGSLLLVGAGLSIAELMGVCDQYELSGMEFSAGVPATLGGMVAMNFGCWGECVGDRIRRVQLLFPDGRLEWWGASELKFGYRYSVLHEMSAIVTQVELELVADDRSKIKQRVRDNVKERIAKQPLKAATFGSVFKNPEGDYAARILESLGYKGKVYGSLQFSEKHANFLVRLGPVSFPEVDRFLTQVEEDVLNQLGIQLEREVKCLPLKNR